MGPSKATLSAERAPSTALSEAPLLDGARTALTPLGVKVSERDVRRRRPPVLSFLLRLSSLRRLARVVSLLALDFLALGVAIFAALVLKAVVVEKAQTAGLSGPLQEARHFLPFAYLLTVLLFARSGLYASRNQRPGMARIVACLFQVMVVALIFAVASGEHFHSYYIFYASLAFALLYVSSLRYLYERVTGAILRAAGYRRRAVLVGSGKNVSDLAGALRGTPHSPIEYVGYLSLHEQPAGALRALGSLRDLERVLEQERVDEVIIADPDFPQEEAVELVDKCHRGGVRVLFAPSTMEILIQRAEFLPGESVPLFELGPPVFEGIDFALKRSFDLVGSILLLVLLSPLLLTICLAVKLTSRGPVLFRSMRPGIGQKAFACLKFRTMYLDAEQRQQALEGLNEASGALFKIRDDPRMTPVGKLLRRFSLDELPQLINVLSGEMSLVGPRPLPQRDYDLLADWHRKRYLVLPGITGLWQVSGRAELDFDDLVHLDFIYLERWSLALDFTILLKTIPAVFTRRGAY